MYLIILDFNNIYLQLSFIPKILVPLKQNLLGTPSILYRDSKIVSNIWSFSFLYQLV